MDVSVPERGGCNAGSRLDAEDTLRDAALRRAAPPCAPPATCVCWPPQATVLVTYSYLPEPAADYLVFALAAVLGFLAIETVFTFGDGVRRCSRPS